jgi:hypothetical protein
MGIRQLNGANSPAHGQSQYVAGIACLFEPGLTPCFLGHDGVHVHAYPECLGIEG